MKPRAARLTPAEVQLIHDLHLKSGWSAKRIADIFDISLATAYNHLPKPQGAARIEDALWLLEQGEHPSHVAQRCGFPSVGAMDKALRSRGKGRTDVMSEARTERLAAPVRIDDTTTLGAAA